MTKYSFRFVSLARLTGLGGVTESTANDDVCTAIARHRYKEARIRYLKEALQDLRAEYRQLYEQALPIAIKDRELGELLSQVEEVYIKAVRRIRISLYVTRILPSRETKYGSTVHATLSRCLQSNPVPQLLSLMEQISARLEPA